MTRAGVLGSQDYENVTKLVQSGTKVGEAIPKVAADRAASRAAVSANFYGTKRKSGGGRRRKASARQPKRAAAPVRANVDDRGDIDASRPSSCTTCRRWPMS